MKTKKLKEALQELENRRYSPKYRELALQVYTDYGYLQFPYFIIRVTYAIYMQIPIHFVSENEVADENQSGSFIQGIPQEYIDNKNKEEQIELLHDKMMDLAKQLISSHNPRNGVKLRMCLVEGKEKAYYFENDEFSSINSIPDGGTLITQNHAVISMNEPHYVS